MAVLFVSAELEEVLRLSHKIAVLRDRQLVAELVNDDSLTMDRLVEHDRERGRRMKLTRTASSGRWSCSWRCWSATCSSRPSFFTIDVQDGHLYGSLIDILRFGAPLMLVALGMTMVIATGGIDLSVGSVVAISGALACLMISKLPTRTRRRRADRGGAALGLSLVLGLWNGVLVAVIGIQPIIATLILMVAGRGIAQLITDGQIITINSDPYKLIGAGYLLDAAGLDLHRRGGVRRSPRCSAAAPRSGMLLESVGGNAEASRLAGIRSRGLILLAYVFCGAVRRHRGPDDQLQRPAPTATTPACGSSSTRSSRSSSAARR